MHAPTSEQQAEAQEAREAAAKLLRASEYHMLFIFDEQGAMRMHYGCGPTPNVTILIGEAVAVRQACDDEIARLNQIQAFSGKGKKPPISF